MLFFASIGFTIRIYVDRNHFKAFRGVICGALPEKRFVMGGFIPLENSMRGIFYARDLPGSGYGYFSRQDVFFNPINPIVFAECDTL